MPPRLSGPLPVEAPGFPLDEPRSRESSCDGAASTPGAQPFYHGTKADLKAGDLIGPGYASNYGKRKKAAFVYLAATLDAAIWGAELASGEGRGRIYIVEPTGPSS